MLSVSLSRRRSSRLRSSRRSLLSILPPKHIRLLVGSFRYVRADFSLREVLCSTRSDMILMPSHSTVWASIVHIYATPLPLRIFPGAKWRLCWRVYLALTWDTRLHFRHLDLALATTRSFVQTSSFVQFRDVPRESCQRLFLLP